MLANLKDKEMLFQANAWSAISLSESDIANLVCSNIIIIFAYKTQRNRISHGQPYITVKQYHSPRANITGAHFLTKCASIHVFFIALAADLQFPVFLISGRNRAPQSRISCPQQAGLPYSRIKEPAGPKEITAVCRARPCGAQSR